MSTRVELQAASIQGHNGSHEQDPDPPGPRAARSTILHLLQEASKLTAPAHSSRLDSNWSTTLSRESSSMVNKGAKDSHLFGASDSFSQHGWSQAFSYNLAKNATVAGDVHKMAAPVGPSIQRSNHWEVMSLINLQCEKLLHHRDPCETDSHSIAYSTVKSSPSGACLQPLPSESGTSSRGIASGSGILEYSPCAVFGHNSLPLAGEEEQQTESVKMTGDVTGDSRGGCREGQDSKSDSRDDSQPPQKAELVDIESSFPVQPAHRDTMEVKLSVITGLKEGSDSAEQNAPNVTRSEKVLPQMVASQASNDVLELLDQSLINSAYDYACVAAFSPLNARKPLTSEPAVALDFYSNLVLTFDPVSDTQPPPLALLSTPPQPPPLKDSKHDGVPSEQEVIHLPAEKNFPAFTQQSHRSAIKSASLSSLTTWPPGNSQVAAEQGQSHPALEQFPTKTMQRTKTPRKQSRPARSASIQHPFEGVVFRMHSELDYSRGQCRLLITSKYRRKPRVRVRSSQSSHRTSSSGEESDLPTGVSKSKACASCCTKKTPMWRDAEDGTPLCNACGIRYKKYRVRCISCWHIPRKEGNSNSCCLKCGNFVKLTAAPRKQTAC